MAENDIYNSKHKYEEVTKKVECWIAPPMHGKRKYWIKHPGNLAHFERLAAKLEARDVSYIRRLRLLQKLMIVCHVIRKDLKEVTRDDIDQVLAYAHAIHKTFESKRDFLLDLRFIWKILFPDVDEHGRDDETIVPYVVRHVATKIDRSRKKMRNDKLTPEEYKIVYDAFFDRPDIQVIIMLGYEGLGRPQEILARKVSDVELHDKYAKVWITEHGKEGVGFIPVIDGVEVLRKWVENHPLKHKPDAPLFFSRSRNCMFKPVSPPAINKHIRIRLAQLGIDKRVTLYSFKRNGITHMRLAGFSDNQIQRRARWTTTKQLHTYDLGNQEDAFGEELKSRGLSGTNDQRQSMRLSSAPTSGYRVPKSISIRESATVIPATGYCRHCGTQVMNCDRFCSCCGTEIARPVDAHNTPSLGRGLVIECP